MHVRDGVSEVVRVQAWRRPETTFEDVPVVPGAPLHQKRDTPEQRLHELAERLPALHHDHMQVVGHDRVRQQIRITPPRRVEYPKHHGAFDFCEPRRPPLEAGSHVEWRTWQVRSQSASHGSTISLVSGRIHG